MAERDLSGRNGGEARQLGLAAGDHVGLAYTTLAPVDRDGKVPDESKDQWLRNLANTAIAPDYRAHVDAWLASFAHTSARLFTLTQPALMRLAWFAALYGRWTRWKDRLLARVRASKPWRVARVLKKRALRRWRAFRRGKGPG